MNSARYSRSDYDFTSKRATTVDSARTKTSSVVKDARSDKSFKPRSPEPTKSDATRSLPVPTQIVQNYKELPSKKSSDSSLSSNRVTKEDLTVTRYLNLILKYIFCKEKFDPVFVKSNIPLICVLSTICYLPSVLVYKRLFSVITCSNQYIFILMFFASPTPFHILQLYFLIFL